MGGRLQCGVVFGLLLAAGACRPSGSSGPARFDPDAINGERALADAADFVRLGPKVPGTPGDEAAARYLAVRLQALGIEPVVDEFTDDTPRGKVRFRNVLGAIPGRTDRTILLLSHYDTKSGIADAFAGANDSGSSTGLLLELARAYAHAPPSGPELLLAFLDGEECRETYGKNDGLHGSRHLAATLVRNGRASHVAAVILLDMIGDRSLTVTIPRNGAPHLASLALDAAREEGARAQFGLSDYNITDDHEPFLEAKIPAVDLIDLEYGSAPGKNDYWHTAADTMDKLSAASLQTVGRVVARMLNRLEAEEAAHPPPAARRARPDAGAPPAKDTAP